VSSERKKADRLAKQIRSQLEKTSNQDEIQRLKSDLHIAEIDSIYARYFPYREAYVSLYPVQKADKAENASSAAQALRAERPPMWAVIEEAAEKGERALIQIRERRSTNLETEPSKDPSFERMSSAQERKSRDHSVRPARSGGQKGTGRQQTDRRSGSLGLAEDSDGESDGGFFEED
jgi:hypothetical protein